MADTFLGEIRIFPYNFAPRGWADCNGQLLSIAQNTGLFSLFGTTYGGDGRTTFAVPDLPGRAAMHNGRGPGLPDRRIGDKFGETTVTLQEAHMAPHSHGVAADGSASNLDRSPTNHYAANPGGRGRNLYGTASPASPMKSLAAVGTPGPHENMQPYQVLRFCVALAGVYPSRS